MSRRERARPARRERARPARRERVKGPLPVVYSVFAQKLETISENVLTFLLRGVRSSFLDSGQIWSFIIYFLIGFLFFVCFR